MRRAGVWFGSLLLACHTAPSQPVPLVGSAGDIAAIAGEWSGYYESDDGARGGSIDFHLKAGRDTAQGDVLMVPRGWGRPLEAWERRQPNSADAPSATTLTIRFVRVQGDSVTGRLDPYRDPACGCRVVATFAGRHTGDRIRGRYEALHQESGRVMTGRWQAERKAPRP